VNDGAWKGKGKKMEKAGRSGRRRRKEVVTKKGLPYLLRWLITTPPRRTKRGKKNEDPNPEKRTVGSAKEGGSEGEEERKLRDTQSGNRLQHLLRP